MEQPAEEALQVALLTKMRQSHQKIQRTCANRRVKRTHLRGVNRPAPDKHSQLFISLLDSGRPTPF